MPVYILIAGVVLCCLTLVVVTLLRQTSRKRQQLMLKCFNTSAEKERLKLTLIDRIGNRMIGIDPKGHKLLFMDTDQEVITVDLKNILGCQVLKNRTFRSIRTIHLQLFDVNDSVLYELLFYQEFIDSELSLRQFERLSGKWQKIINNYRSAG